MDLALIGCGVYSNLMSHPEYHLGEISKFFETNISTPKLTDQENGSHMKVYRLGGSKLVLSLKHPCTLYFLGTLGVKCLAGSIDIDGFILFPDSHSYHVVSHPSHSASCFTSTNCVLNINKNSLNELNSLGILQEIKQDIEKDLMQPSCLLLLWKSDIPNFLKLNAELRHSLQPHRRFYEGAALFSDIEEYVNCIFDIPSGNRINKKISFNQTMRDYVAVLLTYRAPRVLICGGKGVGKSTYSKFMVNQMLSRWGGVLFVDFDIGQPEFNVPGSIAVHFITEPVFGPSYSHLKPPLKWIFIGFVSSDKCFNYYQQAIQEIQSFCSTYPASSEIPMVINTMGFVKGCGLLIINNIISQFNLTHVAELRSISEPYLNFARPPSPVNVMNSIKNCPTLNFVLDTLEVATYNQKSTMSAKSLRELTTFFYFFGKLDELRHQAIFFETDVNSPRKPFVSLVSDDSLLLPGEIVAVCSSESEDLWNCIGLGKVVSCSNSVLVILTPLPESEFESCTIVRGDLSIRNKFFIENLSDKEQINEPNEFKIILTTGKNASCPALFSY